MFHSTVSHPFHFFNQMIPVEDRLIQPTLVVEVLALKAVMVDKKMVLLIAMEVAVRVVLEVVEMVEQVVAKVEEKVEVVAEVSLKEVLKRTICLGRYITPQK